MGRKPSYVIGPMRGIARFEWRNAMSDPRGTKPHFSMSSFEFPVGLRELAEKSVANTREAYDKMKAAAEDATGALEGTLSAAAKGTADYNRKVIEVARANANAAFDYARDLLAAKSISDVAELSSTHARKQFEALSQQTKDLTTLAQRLASETAEPIKTRLNATFGKLA
jgi:phasin